MTLFSLARASKIMQFSPAAIPGLEWWLRADLGTTLNLVSEWADQSGAGDSNRNFVASVQQPTLITSAAAFNNKPVIQFTPGGTNPLMTQAGLWNSAPVGQPYTIITVGKDDAIFNSHRPWIGDANINLWYQASFPSPTVPSPDYFGSSEGTGLGTNLFSLTQDTGQAVIFMSEYNDPNNSTIRINSDISGTQQDGGTGTAIPNIGQLALGWAFGTGLSLNGQIAEVIVIFGILPTSQRQGLLAYLQQRYAITVANLPVGTPPIQPSSIPNLALWTRADMGITASVSAWTDQSGSGDANRNVVQATASHQPFRNPNNAAGNGQPSIHFTQNPFEYLSMVGTWSNAPIAQPYTMIVVGSDSGSGTNVFLGDYNGDNWYLTGYGGFYGASVGATLLGTTPDSTSLKVIMIEANDPSSTIRVNDLTAEAFTSGSGSAGFGNLPQFQVGGASMGSAGPLLGDIFEVIVYRGLISSSNRSALIKGYLAPRYGLTIGP